MKPSPRNIILKIRLNADEYLPYRDKCAAQGTPVGADARRLINQDVALHVALVQAMAKSQPGGHFDVLNKTNRISEIVIGKGPAQGPRRAVRFPGKQGRAGKTVARLRL
jgi:hypothetical protein